MSTVENTDEQTIDFSIVVPVYNSEETLTTLFLKLKKVFDEIQKSFEVIFVEDCGPDKS